VSSAALASDAPAIRRRHREGQAAVALGAVAWSTAGILQRGLSLDVPSQLAGRAFFAFLALLAFTAATSPAGPVAAFRRMGVPGVAVAACVAISSGCFIFALNHTSVARVLFIQASAPMMAALLAFAGLGERVTPRTGVAMAVALGGVAVMVGDPRGGDVVGDVACLVMAFSFAVAIVITRRHRHVSMAPAMCLAQVVLLAAFAPFASPGGVGGGDLALLVALGFGQMGVGLALFTVGARRIPAAESALLTLLEVVLGPLWVWIFLSETADAATLAGGAIVVAAVVLQARSEPGRAPPDGHG
jgi:drug/metabolite transporter (DMT)-like permease